VAERGDQSQCDDGHRGEHEQDQANFQHRHRYRCRSAQPTGR
jgi:hypothetical protein